MLENKGVRDELLYADEKKKEEKGDGEQRDEKGSPAGIVAH
jgi:hypothetical protein